MLAFRLTIYCALCLNVTYDMYRVLLRSDENAVYRGPEPIRTDGILKQSNDIEVEYRWLVEDRGCVSL